MKLWVKIAVTFVAVAVAVGTFIFVQVRSLSSEKITADVFILYGLGGNVGVLNTEVGTVIVDSMTLKFQGKRIKAEAERLTGKPVVMVINTHYHTDHTHGNPAFPQGTRVVSTERTLRHLENTDNSYFSGDAAALLPNETFSGSHVISVGGKTIKLLQPGRGHTDGDLVALFEEDGVLHAGDLFFNKHYPNIDLEGGGSVQEWSNTLDQVLKLSFTRVIPGHGQISDRAGLALFQQFMRELADIGKKAVAQNWTREEAIGATEFANDAGYSEIKMIIPIGLNREFVLERVWEEVTGNFERRE